MHALRVFYPNQPILWEVAKHGTVRSYFGNIWYSEEDIQAAKQEFSKTW